MLHRLELAPNKRHDMAREREREINKKFAKDLKCLYNHNVMLLLVKDSFWKLKNDLNCNILKNILLLEKYQSTKAMRYFSNI